VTTDLCRMLVSRDRIVATYRPDGWPAGAITGYVEDDTFHVEHVIVFNGAAPDALMAMLREGIDEAWAMGCQRIEWYVPHRSRIAIGLAAVGRRLGFLETHRDDDMIHFARER
jgi:hypothetical protein